LDAARLRNIGYLDFLFHASCFLPAVIRCLIRFVETQEAQSEFTISAFQTS
jgi:hypothetical protein